MNIATLNKDHGIFSALFFHMVSSVTKKLFCSFPSIFYMFMKSEFVWLSYMRPHRLKENKDKNVDGC